jgi:phosphatidylglycerol---prolipoprotein diacylglyceryl transferase
MALTGPYVHEIDPIIGSVLGVHLWWYGLCYALGFAGAHVWMGQRRARFGMTMRAVFDLSLLLAAGALVGGRLVEVVFYERPFYREHPLMIPALWLGGMSTHGILLGCLIGVLLFCRLRAKPLLAMTDALVIPAALIFALGRVGNFVDGQIVGSITGVWWAVKFPDAEGYRHPVVLYDGLKNLLLLPVLALAGRRRLPAGALTGLFFLLYASLRIVVDLFREYPTTLMGVATGQVLNALMALMGLALLVVARRRRDAASGAGDAGVTLAEAHAGTAGVGWRRALFVALLLFALVIPSDWTQDVPARYGARHPGLVHSAIYPPLR